MVAIKSRKTSVSSCDPTVMTSFNPDTTSVILSGVDEVCSSFAIYSNNFADIMRISLRCETLCSAVRRRFKSPQIYGIKWLSQSALDNNER